MRSAILLVLAGAGCTTSQTLNSPKPKPTTHKLSICRTLPQAEGGSYNLCGYDGIMWDDESKTIDLDTLRTCLEWTDGSTTVDAYELPLRDCDNAVLVAEEWYGDPNSRSLIGPKIAYEYHDQARAAVLRRLFGVEAPPFPEYTYMQDGEDISDEYRRIMCPCCP